MCWARSAAERDGGPGETADTRSRPVYSCLMKRSWPFIVPGAILGIVGLVWTLQGLNVLRGSAMSGSPLWGTVGPILLVVGLALILFGLVRRRRAR